MDLSSIPIVIKKLNSEQKESLLVALKKRLSEILPSSLLGDPNILGTLYSQILGETPIYSPDLPFVGASWVVTTCLGILAHDDEQAKKNLQLELEQQIALSLDQTYVEELVSQSYKGYKLSEMDHLQMPSTSVPLSSMNLPLPMGMSSPHHSGRFEPKPQPPSNEAVNRIVSDFKAIVRSKNPLLHVSLDQEDITHVNVLIIGPPDTPYEDGFFHFDARYPHDYPWRAPAVTLITTDNGTVRFNPNLYSNGKVCLSILGTWQGPGWSSVQTMQSTFLSIQSLMNAAPYHNEPGHDKERVDGDSLKYNECIHHETLRVAVCGTLERPTWKDGSG